MTRRPILLAGAALAVLGAGQPPVWGQFQVAGRTVQVHGFFSQGFAKSDGNNYLTMNTSSGSASMTDGGLNISTRLTDRLRVGAQFYSRNIGMLSNGKVELDWAFGDYRVKDWLGIRAGKVKTALGLYNDVQDMEFLHTWALLPQSIYPADLRSLTIAHVGGDVYGDVHAKRAGTFSYTAHGGKQPDDVRGGYYYGLADAGLPMKAPLTSWGWGGDLRWTTPLPGLLVGASLMDTRMDGSGTMKSRYGTMPFRIDTKYNRTLQYYVEHQKGPFRLTGEYRRNAAVQRVGTEAGVHLMDSVYDFRAWYMAGAWRLHKRLELGAYHSRCYSDWRGDHASPRNHVFDNVVTARVDLNRYWNVKVEGHFMDGYGSLQAARGFYLRVNPLGFAPTTNMLVVRTGFNF